MKTATLPAAAAAICAALLPLAACSSSQSGQALPQTTTQTQSIDTTSATAASTAIDPCTLLSPSALAQYGTFRAGAAQTLAGARSCLWQRERADASGENLGISANVRDTQSINTVNNVGGGLQTGEVNGRKAVKAPDPAAGTCGISLAIGDKSRVDIGVVSLGDATKACQIATDVAYLVEPKLPKS